MAIEKFVSPYIAAQFPRVYHEEGPMFVEFLKTYFEWLEEEGNVLYDSRRLLEYRDIDTTLDVYLSHFKNKYMQGIPDDIIGDKRTLQKHIKEVFSSKGTIRGLKLLFRLLYNEDVDVYRPGDDVIRPSDGTWIQPIYLEVSVNPLNVMLVGEQITGRQSGATAIVEDFEIRYVGGRQINILFLSNVRGDFITGELLLNSLQPSALLCPTVFGSMTSIEINESGFDFNVGDVLDVVGGSGILGQVVVSETSPRNGAVSFTINDGGSGYANNDPFAPTTVVVTAVDANTNPGIGADFEIGEITDTEVITTAVDVIAPYANTIIGALDYGFPTFGPAENIDTPLDQALNVRDITVGTILTLRAINPGVGYNGPVVVDVYNSVIAGLNLLDTARGNIKGMNANVTGIATAGVGAIDAVKIYNSGLGYANGDVITLENDISAFVAGGVVRLGKAGRSVGYWKDTKSFLNSDKYIQDSFFYQEYSYEVRVAVAFDRYRDLLKKLWHPAGTLGFGKVVIASELASDSVIEEFDFIQVTEILYDTIFETSYQTDIATLTSFNTGVATAFGTTRATTTSRGTSIATTQITTIATTFNTGVGTSTAYNTNLATSRSTSSAYNTTFNTTFGTSRLTGSVIDTSRATTVVTSSVYNTTYLSTYNTVVATATAVATTGSTNRSTSTNVNTLFQTSRSTTASTVTGGSETTIVTNFVTLFNTSTGLNTSRATGTSAETSLATTRSTNVATTTTFGTSFNTFFLTTKNTSYATTTAFNTATAFDTATTYNTLFDTSRATTTSRETVTSILVYTYVQGDLEPETFQTTNIATTFATTTTFGTNFATARNTATSRNTGTSRSTDTTISTNSGTSRTTSSSTSRSTSSAFITTFNTGFVTNYNTTTTFNTAVATVIPQTIGRFTTYATGTPTSTTYNTLYDTTGVTSQSTTTAFNTSFVSTYNTSTAFSTSVSTSRSTNIATASAYNTTYGTTINTITAYEASRNTVVATSVATTTAFNTVFLTTIATDTAVSTSRSTTFDAASSFLTVFATNTGYDTTRNTTLGTNTLTDSAFDTSVETSFETSINTSSNLV